jgi:hypothetical protein
VNVNAEKREVSLYFQLVGTTQQCCAVPPGVKKGTNVASHVSFTFESGDKSHAVQTLRVCRTTGTWIASGWAKSFFRHLTLRSVTGFSQREKHHQPQRANPAKLVITKTSMFICMPRSFIF